MLSLQKYKVLKIKLQLNFVNASYLFTHIRYLEKTYTTTAQELSIYVNLVFMNENKHVISLSLSLSRELSLNMPLFKFNWLIYSKEVLIRRKIIQQAMITLQEMAVFNTYGL